MDSRCPQQKPSCPDDRVCEPDLGTLNCTGVQSDLVLAMKTHRGRKSRYCYLTIKQQMECEWSSQSQHPKATTGCGGGIKE